MDKRIVYTDAGDELLQAGEDISAFGNDTDAVYLSCLRIAELIEGGEKNREEVQDRLSNLHYEMQCILKESKKALQAVANRIDEIDSAAQADDIIYPTSKEASNG